MQIVEYKVQDKQLTVGFKEDNFIVYSVIPYVENKTKENLLQQAYIQIRDTIEYEKTLKEHSFITHKIGEEFIPEESKPTKLEIDFNKLEGKVLDQYGDIYSRDITFSIEGTDKAKLKNNSIIEEEVAENTEYYIIAKYKDLKEKQKRVIYIKTEIKDIVEEENQKETFAKTLAQLTIDNKQKDTVIKNLSQTVAKLSIEVNKLKGSVE